MLSNRIKSLRFGLVAVGLASLTFGAAQGLAGGDPTTTRIEYHSENCGRTTEARKIGTATYSKSGDVVTVSVRVQHADPGTYELELWIPDGKDNCTFVDALKTFTINAQGEGSATGSTTVTGEHAFFATLYNYATTRYNNALIVHL